MKNHIYACIWCNHNASEMAAYYCNTFADTKITAENQLVVMLEMEGQKMMLLNGGDMFSPNPSVSFMVLCSTSDEVEKLYNKLFEGGKALMELGEYPWSKKYGWVEDKFGVTWQLYLGNTGGAKEKYVPTLMFNGSNNGKAKEAIELYTSVFPDSNLQGILEYTGSEGEQKGNVQHAQFDVNGFTLMCMDSSYDHKFNFTEGISLVANCKNQQEIDKYWNDLTNDGGAESMCGWLKDKYGLSWQIIPENMAALIQKPAAMQALMQMKKIVIADLEAAGSR